MKSCRMCGCRFSKPTKQSYETWATIKSCSDACRRAWEASPQRFLSFVSPEPNTGCWLWSGCFSRSKPDGGYGQLRLDGKMQSAHRLSYQLFVGAIPEGLMVLHRCDVRPCVNPQHLFVGTSSDNIQDALAKGRMKSSLRTITPSQAEFIRQSTDGVTALARLFGVTRYAIDSIREGH